MSGLFDMFINMPPNYDFFTDQATRCKMNKPFNRNFQGTFAG